MREKQNHLIIAIDGPAASGKGTVAKKIAQFLDLKYLDTGKLYRLIAARIITSQRSIDELQINHQLKNEIKSFLENKIHPDLNNERIAKIASILSTKQDVRSFLLPIQREFAYSSSKGAVLDGRDISSVILPDANLKIFITATTSIRAKRRFKELHPTKKGMYKHIFFFLIQRDIRDTNRRLSPLLCPKDALYLDTSNMNKEQVFTQVIKKIKTYL